MILRSVDLLRIIGLVRDRRGLGARIAQNERNNLCPTPVYLLRGVERRQLDPLKRLRSGSHSTPRTRSESVRHDAAQAPSARCSAPDQLDCEVRHPRSGSGLHIRLHLGKRKKISIPSSPTRHIRAQGAFNSRRRGRDKYFLPLPLMEVAGVWSMALLPIKANDGSTCYRQAYRAEFHAVYIMMIIF